MTFSRIYLEEEAAETEITQAIIKKLSIDVVSIKKYQAIFNRPLQNFQLQKYQRALILAVKKSVTLYKSQDRIQSFHDKDLFYSDQIRNCLFDCEYCFLQGMHNSAYILCFVNTASYQEVVKKQIPVGGLLSISYLSDLLGFEELLPLNRQWVHFAHEHPHIRIESRTKSANYHIIQDLQPPKNFFLVWSLNPQKLSQQYERGCASFRNRVLQCRMAIDDGWTVRLCFDPILLQEGWKDLYAESFSDLFTHICADSIDRISFGFFRMQSRQLKKIQKERTNSALIQSDYNDLHSLSSYHDQDLHEARNWIEKEISRFYPLEKLCFVHG